MRRCRRVHSDEIQIRDATPKDSAAIAAIYAHHVLYGTASYDTDPPSEADTAAKIARISGAGWPFIVATVGGDVAAYAYVTQLRDRAAYRFTCENSIYVRHDWVGRGIGKRLLAALCERSAGIGFRQMIAVIGGAEPASIALHHALGFEEVGRLRSVGWKKERWLDTVYMQRELAAPDI